MMKENEWESSGNESKYNTIIKRVTISGIKRHAGKKKTTLTCSDAENLGTSQINKHDTKYKTTSDKQPLKKRDDK